MSVTRAARRRAERDLRRLQADAEALHADAAGVIALEILRPYRLLSEQARFSIAHWIAGVKAHGSPLCMCCETDFGDFRNRPDAFVTLTAARDDPALGFVIAICERCAAASDEQLGERGIEFVRRSGLLPDARRLPAAHLHNKAGRA